MRNQQMRANTRLILQKYGSSVQWLDETALLFKIKILSTDPTLFFKFFVDAIYDHEITSFYSGITLFQNSYSS